MVRGNGPPSRGPRRNGCRRRCRPGANQARRGYGQAWWRFASGQLPLRFGALADGTPTTAGEEPDQSSARVVDAFVMRVGGVRIRRTSSLVGAGFAG
jgi:hypothetical protein